MTTFEDIQNIPPSIRFFQLLFLLFKQFNSIATRQTTQKINNFIANDKLYH